MENDTIELLKECNAGVKTAVNSLKEVVELVQQKELKEIIQESIEEHTKIGDKTHEKLNEYGAPEKDPSPMADAMSWLKINVKYSIDPTDHEIASLMIDGCNMGIKSVSEYLNRYEKADNKVRGMVQDLIELEKKLTDRLRVYL